MLLRTVIIDDEPLARERIVQLLGQERDIDVVGECGDGNAAVRMIRKQTPDLIFLDIQMPEMDGFEILQAVSRECTPAVIFVTAFDRFALRAFRVHAVDYLLKPVDGDRLHEALAHVRKQVLHQTNGTGSRTVDCIRDLASSQSWGNRVLLKAEGELLLLKPAEIDWIESAGNYVCFHVGPTTHISRETMNEVEQRLPANFARIHRSAIVNLDQIKRLKPLLYGHHSVELRDGARLTLSRGYRERVLKKIGGT